METEPLAMVIEDNEDQNMIFTAALKQAGYRVESFFDGTSAQKRLSEALPTLIVLDLHMPDVNGDIVLRQIRGNPQLAETTVFLATADAAFANDLQSQVDLVLLKPVSFSQLSLLANRFLGHSPRHE